MSLADVLVLGAIAVLVIAVIVWMVRGKKKGCGNCAGCPYRGECTREEKD